MKNERRLMRELLRGTGLCPIDAARLARNLSECKQNHLRNATLNTMDESDTYRLGLVARAEQGRSVPFRDAVQAYLEAKNTDSRLRTRNERRQVLCRVLRAVPESAELMVRDWSVSVCRAALLETFPTKASRNKGYSHLKGLFRFAQQQEWCHENPLNKLTPEKTQEPELQLLTLEQTGRLLRMTDTLGYRCCAPAVGLMLWAGIRPAEVCRLHWGDIDLLEGVVCLRPQHSKTGGARQVTLAPVLRRWLKRFAPKSALRPEESPDLQDSLPVTPADWVRLWRDLRTEAGLYPWRPDTLRHTFASYHLKKHRSIDLLQTEMGHSNPRQLRTRYLNMRGITVEMCRAFWSGQFDENGIRLAGAQARKGMSPA